MFEASVCGSIMEPEGADCDAEAALGGSDCEPAKELIKSTRTGMNRRMLVMDRPLSDAALPIKLVLRLEADSSQVASRQRSKHPISRNSHPSYICI